MRTPEPTITVNGVLLSEAQAMAVRVAVTDFRYQLADPKVMRGLGEIGPLYDARLCEVEDLMVPEQLANVSER